MNNFLKKLRKKYNFSQEDIANRLSVSRQTYAQIEAGKVELTISRAKKLAKMFGLNLEDFIA